jgi:hypothetical protein
VPDSEPVWLSPPVVVSPPFLRWSLYRGDTMKGIRWALREMDGAARWHQLHLAEIPAPSDLVAALTPILGRPIADTLVEAVAEALPEAMTG